MIWILLVLLWALLIGSFLQRWRKQLVLHRDRYELLAQMHGVQRQMMTRLASDCMILQKVSYSFYGTVPPRGDEVRHNDLVDRLQATSRDVLGLTRTGIPDEAFRPLTASPDEIDTWPRG